MAVGPADERLSGPGGVVSAEINSVRRGASPLDCYSDRLHSSYRRRSDGSGRLREISNV